MQLFFLVYVSVLGVSNAAFFYYLSKRREKDVALALYNLKDYQLNTHRKYGSICIKLGGWQ